MAGPSSPANCVSYEEGDEVTYAAVSSPDIPSPYLTYGGVRRWARYDRDLTQASTTVCAIQSPVSTSTLISGGITFTESSTTAMTITMAKAATPYATTTSLGEGLLAADIFGTFVASTTPNWILLPPTKFEPVN